MPENTEKYDFYSLAVYGLENLEPLQSELVAEFDKPTKHRDKKAIKQLIKNIQINTGLIQAHATLALVQRMSGEPIDITLNIEEPPPAESEKKTDVIGDILSNVDPADMLRKAASLVETFAPKPRPVKDTPQA